MAKELTRSDFSKMEMGAIVFNHMGDKCMYLGIQSWSDHWPVFLKRECDGHISSHPREGITLTKLDEHKKDWE